HEQSRVLAVRLAHQKTPPHKGKLRSTPPAPRNPVFVTGQVDIFISVVKGSPLDLVGRAQQGKDKPVYFMPVAEFGIAPMGQGILAHERVIAEKPDLLRRFVRARARPPNDGLQPGNNPDAANVAQRPARAPREPPAPLETP